VGELEETTGVRERRTPRPGTAGHDFPVDSDVDDVAGGDRLSVVMAVFVGGCAGGLGRYAVTRAWPTSAYAFPWSTFVVNVAGAFALAVLLVVVTRRRPSLTYLRPLLGTGFCGAWTTFSAVVASSDQLVAHGRVSTGVGYVLASTVAGLSAALLGLATGRAVCR
jgi:CrcB protein